jgi:tight adherence protein C
MVLAGGLVAIFVALALIIATALAGAAEKQQVSRSLAAIRAFEATPGGLRKEADVPFADRVLLPSMQRLARIGRRFTPAGLDERVRHRLDLAGNPPTWDVERVIAFKMLGVIVGLAGGLLVALVLGANILTVFGLAVALAAAGYFAPDVALLEISQRRQQQMQKDLPDALDMLSITVEAGLAFNAALAQVARNTEGPLADEFFRVLQEMQLGKGRSEAIRALGERTNVPEVRGFANAMVQADAFGVPVANVLRVQAKEQRVKRSQRAEEKAQKVPVKILFPLIFCIMPSLFIVILGPAAITIYHNLIH